MERTVNSAIVALSYEKVRNSGVFCTATYFKDFLLKINEPFTFDLDKFNQALIFTNQIQIREHYNKPAKCFNCKFYLEQEIFFTIFDNDIRTKLNLFLHPDPYASFQIETILLESPEKTRIGIVFGYQNISGLYDESAIFINRTFLNKDGKTFPTANLEIARGFLFEKYLQKR